MPGRPETGRRPGGRGGLQAGLRGLHKLGGAGNDVGPDLAALDDRSPEALLVAILDPSRAFEAKYTEYTVHLTDGRVRTGLIASETASALTLRRQQGEQDVILRADVEAMSASGKSLMPEGLEKDLTPRRPCPTSIAYLTAAPSTSPPKALAGNRPEVVEAATDGTLVLAGLGRGGLRRQAHVRDEVRQPRLLDGRQRPRPPGGSRPSRGGPLRGLARPGLRPRLGRAAARGAVGGRVRSFTEVASTGSWDNYRRVKVGELTLPAGPGRLDLRPRRTRSTARSSTSARSNCGPSPGRGPLDKLNSPRLHTHG